MGLFHHVLVYMPSCLKVRGWVVVVAYRILVSALVPKSYWDLVGVWPMEFWD